MERLALVAVRLEATFRWRTDLARFALQQAAAHFERGAVGVKRLLPIAGGAENGADAHEGIGQGFLAPFAFVFLLRGGEQGAADAFGLAVAL